MPLCGSIVDFSTFKVYSYFSTVYPFWILPKMSCSCLKIRPCSRNGLKNCPVNGTVLMTWFPWFPLVVSTLVRICIMGAQLTATASVACEVLIGTVGPFLSVCNRQEANDLQTCVRRTLFFNDTNEGLWPGQGSSLIA